MAGAIGTETMTAAATVEDRATASHGGNIKEVISDESGAIEHLFLAHNYFRAAGTIFSFSRSVPRISSTSYSTPAFISPSA